MNSPNSQVPIEPFRFRRGTSPLLVSMPHVGTHVPTDIAASMTAEGLELPDTDWHVDLLHDFLDELDASVLRSTHSRYVVDLNRPPDGENLYPGQDTPGLVPVDTFAKDPIYKTGAPATAEITARVEAYWRPYHEQLAATLEELRAEHGHALLWEAHSIRSEVPRLWEGRLPDLNLGTGGGTACTPGLALALLEVARHAEGYTAVLDGRFKGGYITRHYGDPAGNVQAVQLELSQRTYMQDEGGGPLSDELARAVRPVLRDLLTAFVRGAQ